MSHSFKTVMFLSALCAFSAFAADSAQLDRVPGEFIVKFRDVASSRGGQMIMLHTLSQRLGTMAVQQVKPLETDPSLAVVKMQDDQMTASALNILQGVPAVQYAEPNYIYHTMDMQSTAGTPNDPDFSKQWNMYNTGQADPKGKKGIAGDDIGVMSLWNQGIVGKKDVIVAIIDTGIDWTHPDLKDNLYTNPGEIAGNGKDDDGNGFVDDIHGWNFNKKTADSVDDNGHGSHCAGVIGASANNHKGVVGVNWNVSLMPVKFLDKNGGGDLADAVNAINYARMMKVNVMSNSWGGGGFSQAMYDAIKAANDDGILFVAAAGNDGHSNEGANGTYPASYNLPNIISVAAIDNKNQIASFSNYGVSKVHVAAPGVNIYSTFKKGKYKVESGTSMATPHVAGISALLLSENPHWTPEEIKERLIKTSTPVSSLANKVMANGRVNAAAALSGLSQ
jgi:subtilisin family serine protease